MTDNLLTGAEAPKSGERFETLLERRGVRVERIVSSDRPVPVLYDQDQDEWVALLHGEATLELRGRALDLVAGDHLFIPAHTLHRVLRTTPGAVWLAVHVPTET